MQKYGSLEAEWDSAPGLAKMLFNFQTFANEVRHFHSLSFKQCKILTFSRREKVAKNCVQKGWLGSGNFGNAQKKVVFFLRGFPPKVNSECDGDRDGYDAMVLLTGRFDYRDVLPGRTIFFNDKGFPSQTCFFLFFFVLLS